MATKLTLRMDEKLVNRAKKYAKRSGKSVSQLVADFFSILGQKTEANTSGLSPKVKLLKGILKDSSVDEKDFKRHLEEKYL
jgi:hypothetical protein